jgi:tripartite-type tricarboxylate transporter receptor subunit TctC
MIDLSRRAMVAGLLTAPTTRRLQAADWPARPVTWLVPYPAGGGSDSFGRPIANRLADRLGQSMIIDNRAGAGGTLGTAVAARAPADGYTLLLGDTGLSYAPVIYPKAGFDFDRDFAPISALARVPYVLVVNPQRLDAATVGQFIDAARRKPGAIDMGSAGLGTLTHLAIGLLETRAGIKVTHVPYRGGAPMLQDLLAGQVAAAFVVAGAAAGYVKSGNLRALAVASRRREALLPEVPTADEAGLSDFRATIWFGLFAPRRTEETILDRLHDEVQTALAADAIKQSWLEQGARVELESRADFARFVVRETERWSRIAKAANIQME